jgi:Rps23 Pro-64 3,4-dihydroxylase Tpa1-like proline 4-hydroxylase
MKNYKKISEELNSNGFSLLDDMLPLELANEINEAYSQNKEWEFIDQIRENHYNSILKSDNEFLPRPNEHYSAKFNRSKTLESTDLIKNTFNNYFIPLLKQVSPFVINEFDVRCYKLDKNNYYRSHNDDYAGSVNFIYYVNKEWRWDWGGILNVLSHEEKEFCQPIFPKFNRVVLLNNKVFRAPHFVSVVEEYALSPRYSIVSFNK